MTTATRSSKKSAQAQVERIDVVYLRKSTTAQRYSEQKDNIERGLKEREIYIPDRYWFLDTRSRFKPEKGESYQELTRLIQARKIRNVYIETQSRFGGGRGAKKLFSVLDMLRTNGSHLIDLRSGMDLTADDMATELQTYIQAKKEEIELLDTTFLSLRSKLGKMSREGAWPGGPPPVGYDKAYYKDGRLLWVFHHTEVGKGDQYFPGPDGNLLEGPKGINPPRNDKHNTPKLIPDPTRRKMIEDIFRWWTTEDISRRQIAHRLNVRGDKMYTASWTHANVTTALQNPAYMGTVAYGRTSRAEVQQFDKSMKVSAVSSSSLPPARRTLEDCPKKENAHDAIIPRDIWDKAQAKLEGRNHRASFAPRDSTYYMKGLLFCGHCGKPLTPSSDKKKSGKVYRKYVCPSYVRGQLTGNKDGCKPFRITVEEAEKVVEAKLAELGAKPVVDVNSRAALEAETKLLGAQADELRAKLQSLLASGLGEYVVELREVYGIKSADLGALEWAADIALLNPPEDADRVMVVGPTGQLSVADVRLAIEKLEAKRVKSAQKKLAELQAEHAGAVGLMLDRTSTERMKEVLKKKIVGLEAELVEWEGRCIPLTQQIDSYDKQIAERLARIEEVQKQWPELEQRQKGEALRNIFSRIELVWGEEVKAKLSRYPLKVAEIRWIYASENGVGMLTPTPFLRLLLFVFRGVA